jgi:hypothetical protein
MRSTRELETAQGARTELSANGLRKLTKGETLKNAGISARTANDYEQLTGGRNP